MRVNQINNLKLFQKAALYSKLFNEAIKVAQEENRQKGIPNVYSYRGKFYYELPNGDIVTELPKTETIL
jgi:nucleosome binding factor SPN SPT16 subunit